MTNPIITSSKPANTFRNFTAETWVWTFSLCLVSLVINGLGFENLAAASFAFTAIFLTTAVIGTFALGIRALIVD